MLSPTNRLNRAEDFRHVVRRGHRVGGSLVVAHLVVPNVDKAISDPVKVGFIVAKSVGPAVTRNRVKRRLRHLMRERITTLPGGSMLVLRALPGSAAAASEALGAELDRCLSASAARATR